MASPWLKLWRSTLDNHFLMADMNAFNVWHKILMLVNDRGEYQFSTRELATFMGLPHSTLYKTLVRLEDQKMVKIVATPRGRTSIIKVLNWSKYQGSSTPVRKQISKQYGVQQSSLLKGTSVNSQGNSSGASGETAGKQRGNSDVTNNRGHDVPLDKDIRIKSRSASKTTLDTTMASDLEPELNGYIEMRSAGKYPMTQYALDRLVAKVRKMYPDKTELQKAALDKATMNNWRDIYPLKPDELPAANVGRKRQGNY